MTTSTSNIAESLPAAVAYGHIRSGAGSEPILGYCAWHFGGLGSWFDRVTGEPVAITTDPVTHTICPACLQREVEELKKLANGKPISVAYLLPPTPPQPPRPGPRGAGERPQVMSGTRHQLTPAA